MKHFTQKHCSTIYGMGIGFGGKSCEICNLGNLAATVSGHSENKEATLQPSERHRKAAYSFEPRQGWRFGVLFRRKEKEYPPRASPKENSPQALNESREDERTLVERSAKA